LKELKEELEISTTIAGGINTSLPIMDRTIQKISKEMKDLKNTVIQLDLTDIYRTLNNSTIHSPFKST